MTRKKNAVDFSSKYSDSYRKIISYAMKIADCRKENIITAADLWQSVVRHAKKDICFLLNKKCVFPEFEKISRRKRRNNEILFSSEADRFLSCYGGVMDDVLSFSPSGKKCIESIHITAALLSDPIHEIRDFLHFNGIDPDTKGYLSAIISGLEKHSEKYKKEVNADKSAGYRTILKTLRPILENICLGQSDNIKTIISQLNFFWNRNNKETDGRPLSFCFIGAADTGKSLLASALRDNLHKLAPIKPVKILDMSRFATEQLSLDMIGRDASWKNGASPGELPSRAKESPFGVIIIDNFDAGHPEALAHLHTMLSEGSIVDNASGEEVSFANNVVILITRCGADFIDSEEFKQIYASSGNNPLPKDKITDGLYSAEAVYDKEKAKALKVILNKVSVPLFFPKLKFPVIRTIMLNEIEKNLEQIKNDFNCRIIADNEQIAALLLESLPDVNAAGFIRQMIPSALYAPVSDAYLENNIREQSVKYIHFSADLLPEMPECPPDRGENYSCGYMEKRTRIRTGSAKQLQYRTHVTFDTKNIYVRFTDLNYSVRPSIEDMGFFSIVPADVTFDDLVGLDIPKAKIMRSINYIRSGRKGIRPEFGTILHGVPGTGKTSFAKAVANLLQVPFISICAADFWAGDCESNIRKIKLLFSAARKYDAVVFIDEIDAIGKRDHLAGPFAGVINTLLTELDGSCEKKVIVIAATNRLEQLDPALLRPGRLHNIIETGTLSNPDDRKKLICIVARQCQCRIPEDLLDFIVRTTDSWSPASISTVIREAAFQAGDDAVEISMQDFLKARNIETFGEETQAFQHSSETRHITSIHEAGHAVAAMLYDSRFVQVTVNSQKNALGFLESIPDYTNLNEQKLKEQIDIRLAGLSAEELLGVPTEGSAGDLRQATSFAIRIIRSGLGKFAHYAMCPDIDKNNSWQEISPKVDAILSERKEAVIKLLSGNLQLLQLTAGELEEKGTLTEDEVRKIYRDISEKNRIISDKTFRNNNI